jgi:hypothetical protein
MSPSALAERQTHERAQAAIRGQRGQVSLDDVCKAANVTVDVAAGAYLDIMREMIRQGRAGRLSDIRRR